MILLDFGALVIMAGSQTMLEDDAESFWWFWGWCWLLMIARLDFGAILDRILLRCLMILKRCWMFMVLKMVTWILVIMLCFDAIWRIMLDFDDAWRCLLVFGDLMMVPEMFDDYAWFWWSGGFCCPILMILKMLLAMFMVLKMVLNFGDYAGFWWFGGLCWIPDDAWRWCWFLPFRIGFCWHACMSFKPCMIWCPRWFLQRWCATQDSWCWILTMLGGVCWKIFRIGFWRWCLVKLWPIQDRMIPEMVDDIAGFCWFGRLRWITDCFWIWCWHLMVLEMMLNFTWFCLQFWVFCSDCAVPEMPAWFWRCHAGFWWFWRWCWFCMALRAHAG